MNRVVLMSAGVALAVSLTACNFTTAPAEGNAGASSAAESDSVARANADFLAALNAKDFNKAKTFYAADAVMVMAEMPPYKGTGSIAAFYDEFAKDPAASFDANSEGTSVSSGGDLAYSHGTYQVRYTNPQTKAIDTGHGYYVAVYKKQSDGSWKIVQDISTPIPAAG